MLMISLFWKNTIWFILLGITIIIELILIFIKVRNKKRILALYITISGIVFAFEITITAVLHAYQYLPKILPQKPFDDGIIGNYFSQFSVATTTLLIAVYKLKYYWYLLFAAAYALIETLFLKLKIYEQYWYRTWMTVAGLLLLFWIGEKIYRSGSKRIGNALFYSYVFLGLITLQTHTMWVFRVLGVFSFGDSLKEKGSSLDGIISIAYMFVAFSIMIAVYYSKIKWRWKAAAVFGLFALYYAAFKLHLMYFKSGWFLPVTVVSICFLYFYVFLLDKLYGRTEAGTGSDRIFRTRV